MSDGVDSPCIQKKGICSRPRKIPRHHVADSCSEDVREDSSWEIRKIVECDMGE